MVPDFYYGGQAVINGVMIQGQENVVLALRCPDGGVKIIRESVLPQSKSRFQEKPFIKKFSAIIRTLVLGVKAFLYSASLASGEEKKISPALIFGIILSALVFVVFFFFILPFLLTYYFLDPYVNSLLFSNLSEGILRIFLFFAYLKLVGLIPDARNLFAYHGAEHKVINSYEAGAPLEINSVRAHSLTNLRCGSSFFFIMLLIAIPVFVFLLRSPLWLGILCRLALVPVIAFLSYVVILLATAKPKNFLLNILFSPVLKLQSMTVSEPDNNQLEIALSAMKGILEMEGANCFPSTVFEKNSSSSQCGIPEQTV